MILIIVRWRQSFGIIKYCDHLRKGKQSNAAASEEENDFKESNKEASQKHPA